MKYKNACCVGVGLLVWMSTALGSGINGDKCENIRDSLGVFECSKDKKEYADNSLHENYSLLVARIKSQFERDQPLGEKYLLVVKKSQLAWIDLRNSNCALETFEIEHGSQVYEVVVNNCVARMSEERTDYLSDISPGLQ
jgi:uncharacterized protein YecT (DUF1311 family)